MTSRDSDSLVSSERRLVGAFCTTSTLQLLKLGSNRCNFSSHLRSGSNKSSTLDDLTRLRLAGQLREKAGDLGRGVQLPLDSHHSIMLHHHIPLFLLLLLGLKL